MNISTDTAPKLIIRCFQSLQDYRTQFEAMKQFTNTRQPDCADEIWLLEHHPVLTQGQAGKAEHILFDAGIPIVQTDRGGQVTWHGPGQCISYFMINLPRLNWNVRTLVSFAEQLMIDVLHQYQVTAYAKPDAPGVYVEEKKIGSLGFKIRRGNSYHGFALNIDCPLHHFENINPCGYAGLQMTKLNNLTNTPTTIATLQNDIIQYMQNSGYFSQIDVIFQ